MLKRPYAIAEDCVPEKRARKSGRRVFCMSRRKTRNVLRLERTQVPLSRWMLREPENRPLHQKWGLVRGVFWYGFGSFPSPYLYIGDIQSLHVAFKSSTSGQPRILSQVGKKRTSILNFDKSDDFSIKYCMSPAPTSSLVLDLGLVNIVDTGIPPDIDRSLISAAGRSCREPGRCLSWRLSCCSFSSLW